MSIGTSLNQNELAERIRAIALQKQEGLLTLIREKNAIFLHFKQGEIVRVWEGNEEDLFAEALIRSEKILPVQLEAALRAQNNVKQPLARILLDMGYLDSDEIRGVHRALLEETLYPLYAWETVHLSFEVQPITYDAALVEPFSALAVLSAWENRAAQWQALLLKIPSRETIFEVVPGMLTTPVADGDVALDAIEQTHVLPYHRHEDTQSKLSRTIYQLQHKGEPGGIKKDMAGEWLLPFINGQQTVQEMIEQIGLDHASVFSVYAGLADLLLKGAIRLRLQTPYPTATEAIGATSLRFDVGREGATSNSLSFTLSKSETTQGAPLSVEASPRKTEEGTEHVIPTPSDLPEREGEVSGLSDGGIAILPDGEVGEVESPVDAVKIVPPLPEEAGAYAAQEDEKERITASSRTARRVALPVFSAAQIRFLVNSLLGLCVVALLIVARSSLFAALSIPEASSKAVQILLMHNEEDRVHFALALYYLEHQRFPETLQTLGFDASLHASGKQAIDLSAWSYRLDGASFDLERAAAR